VWGVAGLDPIGLHEARHTCASLMIAAGVNPKALSAIMGHATIAMTFDTYGHLMPDGLDQAAMATNAYLARLDGRRPDAAPSRQSCATSV
jgi:integrase